jgi:DNA processing protein
MDREELGHWLRLTLTPGIGPQSARKLLAAFGPPSEVFDQPQSALQQVVSARQAQDLQLVPDTLPAQIERSWTWLQEGQEGTLRRRIVTLGDDAYPQTLLNIADPPLMLYLMGAGQLDGPAVAVVGSRNPTPQGAANAREFARALGLAGLTVVSGLALGVDAAAHEGALQSLQDRPGRLATVAVVGTGLDRVYPQAHRDLAHRIARDGMLVSEYPLGTPPLAANFPRRNRIIAGLSQGTLVVEAALQSGSLITARMALEQGREVFAIPGSIHSTQARGCHALIKQGAKLVESAQDVLEEMALAPGNATEGLAPAITQTRPQSAQESLLQALGHDPVGLDALQARVGMSASELQVGLMTLELEGRLARLPGGLYQQLAAD